MYMGMLHKYCSNQASNQPTHASTHNMYNVIHVMRWTYIEEEGEKKTCEKWRKKAQFIRINTCYTKRTHKKNGQIFSFFFFFILNCLRCCYCCCMDFLISFHLFYSRSPHSRSPGRVLWSVCAFLYLVSSCLVLTRADHRGENCRTEFKQRLKMKIMYMGRKREREKTKKGCVVYGSSSNVWPSVCVSVSRCRCSSHTRCNAVHDTNETEPNIT